MCQKPGFVGTYWEPGAIEASQYQDGLGAWVHRSPPGSRGHRSYLGLSELAQAGWAGSLGLLECARSLVSQQPSEAMVSTGMGQSRGSWEPIGRMVPRKPPGALVISMHEAIQGPGLMGVHLEIPRAAGVSLVLGWPALGCARMSPHSPSSTVRVCPSVLGSPDLREK